jgi:hypothetical protein
MRTAHADPPKRLIERDAHLAAVGVPGQNQIDVSHEIGVGAVRIVNQQDPAGILRDLIQKPVQSLPESRLRRRCTGADGEGCQNPGARRKPPGWFDPLSGGAFRPARAQYFDHPAGFVRLLRCQKAGRYPGFQQVLSAQQLLGAVVFSILMHEFQIRQLHDVLHLETGLWSPQTILLERISLKASGIPTILCRG